MAGAARLSPGGGRRLLALTLLVLVLHVLALDWLARHLQAAGVLRPLPTPMFTRLLVPAAPATPPAPAAIVGSRPDRPAVTSIAKSAPRTRPQPKVPKPKHPASAPAGHEAKSPPVDPVAESAQRAAPEPAAPEVAATEPQKPAPAVSPQAAASAPASVASAGTAVASAPAAAASAPATLASGPSGPSLDSWPVDTRLNYRLGGMFRSGELHGSARVQWQRQEQRYETRVEIDLNLLASLTLTSQGQVTPEGLKPKAYEELRRSGPRGAKLGEDTIVLANGTTVPRPPGVQDTASQFVELSHRFAYGLETLEVGRSVSLWMARPGGVDLWTYDIVGLDTLRTPQLGEVQAFHLVPRPLANPRGNITAEMWFAPTLEYLPVRIRVNMGEATYVDLVVENIEQR